MAKLYFKYGAMGSSKTANALITRFNYQERNMKVWLIKPSIDDRDGANVIRSRIGLEAIADVTQHRTHYHRCRPLSEHRLWRALHGQTNSIDAGLQMRGGTRELVLVRQRNCQT